MAGNSLCKPINQAASVIFLSMVSYPAVKNTVGILVGNTQE
jgi:hypothetical protein